MATPTPERNCDILGTAMVCVRGEAKTERSDIGMQTESLLSEEQGGGSATFTTLYLTYKSSSGLVHDDKLFSTRVDK